MLVDVNFSQLKFVLGQDTLDIVAEFDNNTIRIYVGNETNVLFLFINFISIEKKIFFGGFDNFLIIRDFDDLIPLIKSHDSKSVSFFILSLSVDLEVGERNDFGDLSNCDTDLFGGSDLVSFEVIIFLDIQFISS